MEATKKRTSSDLTSMMCICGVKKLRGREIGCKSSSFYIFAVDINRCEGDNAFLRNQLSCRILLLGANGFRFSNEKAKGLGLVS